MEAAGLLVIGVGNVLFGDDGVGPLLAELLGAEPALLPAGTTVVDGGTLGLALLPAVLDARALLVLDAVDVDAAPGTVTVLRGRECEGALGRRLSAHQVAVADLLGAARLLGFDGSVALVGVQPSVLGPGLGPSGRVGDSLAEAVQVARREARALCAPPVVP